MIVGTVREIENHEYRAGLTPESIEELTTNGHHVLVETAPVRESERRTRHMALRAPKSCKACPRCSSAQN